METKKLDEKIPSINLKSLIGPTIGAIILRAVIYIYFHDYLEDNLAFIAPWNSFQGLRDAVALWRQGIALYAGGYHSVPWIAYLFAPVLSYDLVLFGIFTAFDLLAGFFLYKFTLEFLNGKDEDASENAETVYKIYILNPLGVGVCAVFSLSSFANLLLSAALYSNYKGKTWLTLLLVSLVAQINIYYIVLLFAVAEKDGKIKGDIEAIRNFLVRFLFAGLLYAVNGLLANLGDVFQGNIMFFMRVEDQTPNVGVFWYMFTQVFQHYRLFFLFVFQILAFIYVFPLWRVMKSNPFGLWFVYLQIVAIVSSYPTYAEFCAYLPLFFAFTMYHKYYHTIYIITTALLLSLATSTITLTQWLQTGSGNANFYFGSCTAYILALIGLAHETVNAHLILQHASWSGVTDPSISRYFANVPASREKKVD